MQIAAWCRPPLSRAPRRVSRGVNKPRHLRSLSLSGPDVESQSRDLEEAARAIGRQILMVNAANEREFHAAFAKVVQAGAGGLLIGSGPFFLSQRRQLVALAGRHALPTMYNQREYAEAGGLISYGPSKSDAYRRAGVYVGRILKGEKPGDLPVDVGPNSSWSSILPPQRHSASKSHQRCSHSPTRSSNDHKDEAARVHHAARWRGGRVAARGARTTGGKTAANSDFPSGNPHYPPYRNGWGERKA